jgi:hypothetical protein
MLRSLREGALSVRHAWGLVLLVLATNLAAALVLAAPLALQLERELDHRGASSAMMYGFDYDWWSRWSEDQNGPGRALSPELLGTGFALKNLELLLDGYLPAGLFAWGRGPAPVDPIVLAVGLAYLALQAFLTGGLLSVYRRPRAGWTVRGLAHGSGFYFGRMLRLSVLSLALVGAVFALNAPVARWLDHAAREAVSGRSAAFVTLGRHAALLAALLLVHMVVSHARVLVVREARRLAAAMGQYLCLALASGLLLAIFALADSQLVVVGFRTQAVALVLFEAFVAARIALRLWLLASQLELQREAAGPACSP